MNKERSSAEILEEEGWTRRFVACEPRLSEAVDLYQEMGYEVRLGPFSKEPECESCSGIENETECSVCFEGYEEQYKTIFTRPKKTSQASDTD